MFLVLFVIGLFLQKPPVIAESPASPLVVINEVMWAGMQYVELFNNTEEDIELEGWTLVRERLVSGEPRVVVVDFDEEDKITGNGYFLLERKTLADTTPPMFEDGFGKVVRGSGLMLVNAGERLELRSDKGELIDEVNKLGAWFAGFSGSGVSRSMERIDSQKSGTDPCNWQTYGSEEEVKGRLGTPLESNSESANRLEAVIELGSPQVLTGAVVEVDGSGSKGILGSDIVYEWDFGDGAKSSEKISFHTYDKAGIYEISLTVSECGKKDEVVAAIEVVSEEDDSFIEPPTSVYKKVSIKDVRKESLGQLVSVEGMVTALPGVFGDRILYLADVNSMSGLQIYFSKANWPGIKLGDILRIDGEISSVLGEIRLKVSEANDILFVKRASVHNPYSLATGDINQSVEGALVSVSGAVTRSSGNTFYIDDGSGDLRIVVRDTTGIKKPSTRRGTNIRVTGIVSRTTLGYRVMPRFQADMELLDSDEELVADLEEGEVLGESIKEVALKDIRQEEIGSYLVTEGVVSAPPGVLGDRIAYISGSGIQLYFHQAAWPDLKPGDRIRVSGELASSLGEFRLKITDSAEIVKTGETDAPQPNEVSTGAIGEGLEGSLVRIKGRITQTSGSTFYVDDGSGAVRVVIQKSTNINKPRTPKGTAASITGVVSHTNSGYRLLPRFQEDVAFGGDVAGLKSFPAAGFLRLDNRSGVKTDWLYFLSGAAVMFLFSGAYHSGEPLLRRKRS